MGPKAAPKVKAAAPKAVSLACVSKEDFLTLQGTNISDQWKRKLIFPTTLGWDMLHYSSQEDNILCFSFWPTRTITSWHPGTKVSAKGKVRGKISAKGGVLKGNQRSQASRCRQKNYTNVTFWWIKLLVNIQLRLVLLCHMIYWDYVVLRKPKGTGLDCHQQYPHEVVQGVGISTKVVEVFHWT